MLVNHLHQQGVCKNMEENLKEHFEAVPSFSKCMALGPFYRNYGILSQGTFWSMLGSSMATLKKWGEQDFVTAFLLCLEGSARGWLNTLAVGEKDTKNHIKTAFTAKFKWNEQ